ncbi:ABC transporter, partial [bacterium]|nr:ABC transporter [bacterium]
KTGTTIFYVTHDQEVALAISDRMAIMDENGKIRQTGTPDEVYEHPADEFVHKFLGIPNYIPFTVRDGEALMPDGNRITEAPPASFRGASGKAGCRPMDILLDRDAEAPGAISGKILRLSLLGPIVDYLVEAGGVQLRAQMQTEEAAARDMIIEEGGACGLRLTNLRWFAQSGEAVR